MHVVLPVHRTRPAVQVQLPLWQLLSLAQAFPHPPQLALSVAGVMQVPLHASVPVAHAEVPPAPVLAPDPPLPVEPALPVAPALPVVPAVPLAPLPAEPLPTEVPPEPLLPPDENDPHERTRAPSDTMMDTGTRERMVFMRHLQSCRSLDEGPGAS